MSPRRRKADKCAIVRLWDSIQPYWEITCTFAGAAVVVILWFGNVAGHDGRITENSDEISRVKSDMQQLKQDVAVIKEAVLFLKEDRVRK